MPAALLGRANRGGLMVRAALFVLAASSALVAGAAQAQQICCVPARVDGMRGYAQADYPPARYAPAYSDRPTSSALRGYVGVEYGRARVTDASPATRAETWTGEGAVSGQAMGFGLQGDLKVANYSPEGGSDSTAWSPTLHAYKRTEYGLIGGWTGWSHTKGQDLFGIGVEGQAYFGSATLYGAAGYGHVDAATDQNAWTARLEGRYFLTDNFMLNAVAGLVRARTAGVNSTVTTLGFGAEYQPDVAPFSIQAGYTHSDVQHSTVGADTVRVGLRWNFNGGSLAERDRLGPSLNNVTDLFQSN